MKVIIDWRVFFDLRGGAIRAHQTILPLLSQNYGCEFGFLTRARKNEAPTGLNRFSFGLPPLVRQLPEGAVRDFFWKRKLDSLKSGLFHSPFYSLPPSHRIPCVAMFYDLIPELFAAHYSGPNFDRLRERKAWLAKNSRRLIAISQSTRNDLVTFFKIDPERIDVIPLGVEAIFLEPPHSPATIEAYRKKWALDGPFLLLVGGRDAHKNFSLFLESYGTSGLKNDFHVITAGEPWSPSERAKMAELGVQSRIKNLAWPDDAELKALYESCAAFVYPSQYEGFGLPPLEAMACRAPIALAAVSSIPEVAGEAGFYFDPTNPTDMARVIRLAAEAGRDSVQVRNGKDRSRRFTWAETARLTAQTYQKALVSS